MTYLHKYVTIVLVKQSSPLGLEWSHTKEEHNMKTYRGMTVIDKFKNTKEGQYCLASPIISIDEDEDENFVPEDKCYNQVVLLQKLKGGSRTLCRLDVDVFTSLSDYDKLEKIPDQEFRRNLERLTGIPADSICITKGAVRKFNLFG